MAPSNQELAPQAENGEAWPSILQIVAERRVPLFRSSGLPFTNSPEMSTMTVMRDVIEKFKAYAHVSDAMNHLQRFRIDTDVLSQYQTDLSHALLAYRQQGLNSRESAIMTAIHFIEARLDEGETGWWEALLDGRLSADEWSETGLISTHCHVAMHKRVLRIAGDSKEMDAE